MVAQKDPSNERRHEAPRAPRRAAPSRCMGSDRRGAFPTLTRACERAEHPEGCIKDKKPEASPPAFISGVSGGLLAACLSNRIPCTALLIPSITGIPDPEGAAILIEKTNELANNPFKIDVRQLRSEAEALKRQLQELINSVNRQQQDQQKTQPGTGTGMYS